MTDTERIADFKAKAVNDELTYDEISAFCTELEKAQAVVGRANKLLDWIYNSMDGTELVAVKEITDRLEGGGK